MASSVALEPDIMNDVDALIASEKARVAAMECGFSEVEQTRIAIATLELARNIVAHASGKGKVTVTRGAGPKVAVVIVAEDQGPGIANVEEALYNNPMFRKGLGVGLGSVKRLMDKVTIETKLGRGTKITAEKWKKNNERFAFCEQI